MKSSSLFPVVVLVALGTLAPWAAEGAENVSKAGACPAQSQVKCLRIVIPDCQSDGDCPGKQKCCSDVCSVKCVDPVDAVEPAVEKAGKCPVVELECLMLNPPNQCETDSQCDGNLKCCKGSCGKACLSPVLA
ncbi:antileukoproteinase-like isoform X3 [Ochotona curzoniae]|uniref:antileukoproteinase-like isoform X3 n=1 Tax=Ochotona curzoniae TaxID=130825 RepID=UPI001B34FECB|nr:antileukoproteinase-like isoform X3 [Ochotona curzoniae]